MAHLRQYSVLSPNFCTWRFRASVDYSLNVEFYLLAVEKIGKLQPSVRKHFTCFSTNQVGGYNLATCIDLNLHCSYRKQMFKGSTSFYNTHISGFFNFRMLESPIDTQNATGRCIPTFFTPDVIQI